MLQAQPLIYGFGGIIIPFIGIKLIDVIINAVHLASHENPPHWSSRSPCCSRSCSSSSCAASTRWSSGPAPRRCSRNKANGSLIVDKDGTVRGSALLAQNFSSDKYFQPRPSAAGNGYDATSSGGTNFGPTSQKLSDSIKAAVAAYRTANGLGAGRAGAGGRRDLVGQRPRPPHQRRQRLIQAARVAKARSLAPDRVQALIAEYTDGRDLGILGEPGVNVLRLNVALDQAAPVK
jgi:K+-transporting ATPase ATPase C chain